MAKARIELDSAGIQQLLNDPGIAGACMDAARKISGAAGTHYKVEGPYAPGSRALALVVPADGVGAVMEARDKTLSKVVSGCRL